MSGVKASDFWDLISRAIKGGARELDMGDIKSPAIKKGRPPKIAPISTPVTVNDINVGTIDPLAIKKGRPAKSPIIEPNEIVLDKAKGRLQVGDSPSSPVSVNELNMGDITPISPNIDDYRLPVSSAGTSPVGGGKVPSILGETADDIAGPLTTRSTTIPTEVGPQVLGKGTSRFTGKADDIIEAEYEAINKMPEGPLKNVAIKKFNLTKPAKIVATGLAGGYVLHKLNEESPSVEFNPPKINGAPEEEETITSQKPSQKSPQQSPSNKTSLSSGGTSGQAALQKNLDQSNISKEEAKPAESDRLSYMEMMQNAQETADKNKFNAILLKAAMQAGAAIAGPGVKMDTSIADALAESANQPVSDIEKMIKTEAASHELQKIKEEMNDDTKMRDPNSEVSKFLTGAAIKAGVIKPGSQMSAMALKNSGVNIGSLLTTIESIKSRESIARENALDRKQRDAEMRFEKAKIESTKKEEKTKEIEKLTPKQNEALTNLDNAEAELNNLLNLLGDNDEYVGMVDSLVPDWMTLGDRQVAFRTATGKIEDVYRHAVTGAGAGATELKTLKSRVPNISDRPIHYKAKANEAIADIKRKRQILLDNLKKQGKNVTEYQDSVNESPELTTIPVSGAPTPGASAPLNISPETREKRIKFIMDKGHTREEAIKSLKDAGKI